MQNASNVIIAGTTVILILAFTLLWFFKHKGKNIDNQVFSKYIESYTAGVISKESTIRIKLANQVQTTHAQNEQLGDDVFQFSPSVKGKAYWVDAQTIEFKPDGKLDPDKEYNADFNLGAIIRTPGDLEHFEFSFKTIKPDFSIAFLGLQSATATSLDKMSLTGTIQTADKEDNGAVEKLISADYAPVAAITWQNQSA